MSMRTEFWSVSWEWRFFPKIVSLTQCIYLILLKIVYKGMEYKRHSEKCWKTHHNHSYHHCFTDDHRGGYRTVQSLPFSGLQYPLAWGEVPRIPSVLQVLDLSLCSWYRSSWSPGIMCCLGVEACGLKLFGLRKFIKQFQMTSVFFFFQLHLCKFFIGRIFFCIVKI